VVGYIFYQKTIDSNPTDTPAQEENSPGDEVFRDEDSDPDNSGESTDGNGNQNNSEQSDDNNDNNSDNTNGNDEQEEPEEPQQQINVVEKGTGAEPESTVELLNADQLNVRFYFKENGEKSWIGIRNGKGKNFIDRVVRKANDPELKFDLTGENRLRIRVARPQQVGIEINGEPFEYPVAPEAFTPQNIWINVGESSTQ